MTKYLIKRFLLMLPTLFGVALVTFVLIRVIPGDVVELRYSGDSGSVSQEIIDRERARIGLDKPVWHQFLTWMAGVVRLDFGTSMWTGAPIWEEIKLRFALSLQVAIMATIVAVVLAIPLGVLSALKQDTWIDYIVRVFSIAGLAMPSFWLGIVLMVVFALQLGWLPASGMYAPYGGGDLPDLLAHLILPAITLAAASVTIIARLTRATMLETLGQDYIRTARAKGVVERAVVLRHGLGNALIPIVTVIGVQAGYLLGGAVLTETVFAWPGVGTLMVQGILARDFPLVQGCVLVVALSFVLINLAVDLLYAWLDPRIRYE